jgi:hypothetical protein
MNKTLLAIDPISLTQLIKLSGWSEQPIVETALDLWDNGNRHKQILLDTDYNEQIMTTLTLDDELINQVIAKSPYKNANEAVMNILFDYVKHNKEKTFFEQICLENDIADDDLALLFERDKDTGRDIEL